MSPYFLDVSAFLASEIKNNTIANLVTFTKVDLNEGSDYNLTTGEFVCRIPGTYLFSATIENASFATDAYCQFYINSFAQYYIQSAPREVNSAFYTASASVVFRLNATDRVYMGGCSAVSFFKLLFYWCFHLKVGMTQILK